MKSARHSLVIILAVITSGGCKSASGSRTLDVANSPTNSGADASSALSDSTRLEIAKAVTLLGSKEALVKSNYGALNGRYRDLLNVLDQANVNADLATTTAFSAGVALAGASALAGGVVALFGGQAVSTTSAVATSAADVALSALVSGALGSGGATSAPALPGLQVYADSQRGQPLKQALQTLGQLEALQSNLANQPSALQSNGSWSDLWNSIKNSATFGHYQQWQIQADVTTIQSRLKVYEAQIYLLDQTQLNLNAALATDTLPDLTVAPVVDSSDQSSAS